MKDSASNRPESEGTEAEQQRPAAAAGYQADERFAFCPKKELNLPASYEEVVERFKRLQSGRAMEALN
ncbi:MAG: hypothetical protein ACK4L7_10260 [Flavobacteriales bacterium]